MWEDPIFKAACHALARTLPALAVAVAVGLTSPAVAQDVSLNYETLSSMEEPLAIEIGGVTLVLSGLVDAALIRDAGEATDTGLTGNLQIDALTQLPNRWHVGLSYFGQYDTDEPSDRYTDNGALSVGGVWGTLLAGDVSGIVREQTRRLRGAGNASLAFDGALGEFVDRGGGYVGRFGPWVLGTVVDSDGDIDSGMTFQRPLGDRDYRLALRLSQGTYSAADDSRRFDTKGGQVVAEVVHGSMAFDVGVGHERFSSDGPDADRWYVSTGMRRKTGMVSMSLEGHLGRIGDQDELSVAVGLQYDLARGLSANVGLNHAEAKLITDGVRLIDTRETRALLSLRYSI